MRKVGDGGMKERCTISMAVQKDSELSWKHCDYPPIWGNGHEFISDTNLPTCVIISIIAQLHIFSKAEDGYLGSFKCGQSSVTQGEKGSELRKFTNEGL